MHVMYKTALQPMPAMPVSPPSEPLPRLRPPPSPLYLYTPVASSSTPCSHFTLRPHRCTRAHTTLHPTILMIKCNRISKPVPHYYLRSPLPIQSSSFTVLALNKTLLLLLLRSHSGSSSQFTALALSKPSSSTTTPSHIPLHSHSRCLHCECIHSDYL